VQPAVSGLEQEFSGKVSAQNVDATTPESKEICQDLGFANHGLVIRSPGGETLWKQPDHDVNIDDVRAELEKLTQP
jgi:hypothetical protein